MHKTHLKQQAPAVPHHHLEHVSADTGTVDHGGVRVDDDRTPSRLQRRAQGLCALMLGVPVGCWVLSSRTHARTHARTQQESRTPHTTTFNANTHAPHEVRLGRWRHGSKQWQHGHTWHPASQPPLRLRLRLRLCIQTRVDAWPHTHYMTTYMQHDKLHPPWHARTLTTHRGGAQSSCMIDWQHDTTTEGMNTWER